tara:strand:- start:162 stop:563 length:402 start_codon:yes stop_codon:yes gene_type:complete
MNITTNGNVVRTKVKLFDGKGEVVAIFATGNNWSDGKLEYELDLIGNAEQVGILVSPDVELKGEINKDDKFVLSHYEDGELYGFWNHPKINTSLTEKDEKKIKTALKSKSRRFELVISQEQKSRLRRERLARK